MTSDQRKWSSLLEAISPWIIHLGLVVALYSWSWRQWPALITDSGHTAYIIWRVSLGELLYHDFDYSRGPFSIYFCAAMVRLFGVSLQTLFLTNAAFVWGIAGLLHIVFARFSDRRSAFGASFAFLLVFAFSQYIPNGNYNFIFPYKFEANHGVFFFLLFLCFGIRLLRNHLLVDAAAAGIAMGFCLLTTYEPAIGALGALFWGAAILVFRQRTAPRFALAHPAVFLGGLLAPLSWSLVFFARRLPVHEALDGTFQALSVLYNRSGIAGNIFYQNLLGTDALSTNLALLALSLLAAGALLGLLAFAHRISEQAPPWRQWLFAALLVLVFYLVLFESFPFSVPWWNYSRLLPLVALGFSLAPLAGIFRPELDTQARDRLLLIGMWGFFSLVVILKMALNARIEHYGFLLAMPAMLGLVIAFTTFFPDFLHRRWGKSQFARIAAIGISLCVFACYLRDSQRIFGHKTLQVGRGADAVLGWDPRIFPQDHIIGQASEWLTKNLPPSTTLLAVPEGLILNYFSRLRSPSRYALTIVHLTEKDEARALESWKLAPPDYIALMHRDTREFGLGQFGASPDYGQRILRWVQENYTAIKLFGAPPLRDDRFGIQILKRNESAPAEPTLR